MFLLHNVPKDRMTPDSEGKTHYNIYSRSRTELGRFLSHFAYHPMDTVDGVFNSMEGYWYWLKYRHDDLRSLYGNDAKQFGQTLAKSQIVVLSPDDPKFKHDIITATSQKLLTMPPKLRFQLAHSRLPLIHAYEHQGKYSFQNSMDFIIQHINRFRLEGYLK